MEQDTVRLVKPEPEREVLGEPDQGTPGDYRQRGIDKVKSYADEAVGATEDLSNWARTCSAVPEHLRGPITDLEAKARRIELELRDMK